MRNLAASAFPPPPKCNLRRPSGKSWTDTCPPRLLRATPAAAYVKPIVILYIPTFLLGAWIYIKYRTYVRIPMEQFGHWWTVGSFEFKEHIVSMGMGLLPAYWYFWRQPLTEQHETIRKWLVVFLAISVWYSFLVGHVANDFRGVGA